MSRKLLLADDSITIQKVIQITFAHEDYELTITDNGDAAFTMAKELKPDLVMADVYMPGKNGYELCEAIKQDPELQQVPVLLLAGSFEPFDEDKAKSVKAEAWIEKPFESQTLLDKIAELLQAASSAPAPAPEAVPVSAPLEPAPAPVVEEPSAFEMPAVEMPAVEDPMAAFGEPVSEELMAAEAPAEAPMEDPFADVSFDEATPAEEPAAVAPADDWSDLGEPVPAAEVAPEPAEISEDVFAAAEPAAEVDDFVFEEEAPMEEIAAPESGVDFSFTEQTLVEEPPMAEAVFDDVDDLEAEIMPLGDDDILGAEDLEPAPEEPTLAAWSRGEMPVDEDVFAEPLAEEPVTEAPAIEPEVPAFDPEPPAYEPEPAFEPAGFGEAPAVEEVVAPALGEEPDAVIEPAAVAASLEEAEQKVSGLSEADLEAIVERVAGQVIEKLANTVLEKVAWEVVPDLAENLIREEIRKIKETAA